MDDTKIKNFGIEDQLLYASLLCGMKPNKNPVYRMQLFFVANKDIRSKYHQSDFQRALQTGVDSKGLWDNFDYKGSAEYVLTSCGHQYATSLFRDVIPKYRPTRANDFRCRLIGQVKAIEVELMIQGRSSQVFINKTRFGSAKEACRFIEQRAGVSLSTTGESAVRVLYNCAIDHKFQLIWESK